MLSSMLCFGFLVLWNVHMRPLKIQRVKLLILPFERIRSCSYLRAYVLQYVFYIEVVTYILYISVALNS